MKAAVYFGSYHIYYDMVAAYKSLLVNSDVDKVFLLIEDDTFPFPLHPDVEVINIKNLVPKIFNPRGANYCSLWTYIGMIRGALATVFPQFDKILSIDCDTVVVKDISDLWDIPMDDYYVAGVKEPALSAQHQYLYVNAGVTMWNLKKMREDGKDKALIHALDTKPYIFCSQDALNEVLQGGILELPSEYNATRYTEQCNDYRVAHFAGGNPPDWRNLDIVKHYRDMPDKEVRILHTERLMAGRQM